MNVKFYLSDGKNESTIRACFIADRNHQSKVQIPFKIESKYWDKKNQIAKKAMHGSDVFNESLLMYRLELLKQIRLMNFDGINDWIKIKEGVKLFIKTGSYKSTKACSLLQGINLFLIAKNKEYKPGTIYKYKVLITLIKHFELKYKIVLTSNKLDYSVVEKFRQYVLYDRKNRNDTAHRMIASIKCVIRWLIQNGYEIDSGTLKVNQPVKSKYEIVTLSDEEIHLINNSQLSIEQEKVKDCFLFQIYTGQRYSDMQQLSPEQVVGSTWKFRSIKTGKLMHVPFVGWTSEAQKIAKKYKYSFPKYSQQYFNRALKLIGRNAGIDEIVRLTRYRGSQEIIIEKPKYQLISSHTARRTCVSLLLAKGVPPTIVMKLTGHTDIKTMMKYERTTTDALEKSLMLISGL